jgi:nucleoside-diphosphate-sugar epimerase
MKIAITGSSGFIGGHLKEHLKKDGHEIIEWDRKNGRDINGFEFKTTSVHGFELEGAEFVIHLAADADVRRSIEEPDAYWHNNVIPTTRIQRICHEAGVPLLYASSSCIHAWHQSPYGISKKVNEETAFPGQVGLRFTTVYGGDGAQRGMFMDKIKDGSLKYATKHIRDFIHIDDVIQAIDCIMLKITDPGLIDAPLRPAYDIGTGTGNVVHELARIRIPGIDIRLGDDCEAQDNTADITHIKELGFNPTIDVRDYLQS